VTAIRLAPELRASIDEWATQQPDKPSRSEALRRLASKALASQEPVTAAEPFVGLRLPAELLDVVDAWTASKHLTRPRAIRALIDAGIVASIPHTKLRPVSDAPAAAKPDRKKSR
jgi:metal-responsive CopG/Arc/MetJ family transcriptional regulator